MNFVFTTEEITGSTSLMFQLLGGVLVVEKKTGNVTFYPEKDPIPLPKWGKDAETIKAAASILAATYGMTEYDVMRRDVTKLLLDTYEAMEIHTRAAN